MQRDEDDPGWIADDHYPQPLDTDRNATASEITPLGPLCDRHDECRSYADVKHEGAPWLCDEHATEWLSDQVDAWRARADELERRAESDASRADRAEARIERGGDLHALITNGHHMERLLHDLLPLVAALDADNLPEHAPKLDHEDISDLCSVMGRATYEWDKRARRSGVDWWNRAASSEQETTDA